MEKIKVKKKEYPIVEARYEGEHLLRIEFVDAVPPSYGDIKLYTSGDIECAYFPGFNTIYRQEGKCVWLSDDESVYEEIKNESQYHGDNKPYTPSIEEMRAVKWKEVNEACNRIIAAGIDVRLSNGDIEHFSLTEVDQLNLFGLRAQLAAGASSLPYHADNKPCRFYSADDMNKIINEAMKHATYHTTYCNALHIWINACEAEDTLSKIVYGADVPLEYQSDVLKSFLKELAGAAE